MTDSPIVDLLAVDGGNSKADVILATRDGHVLAFGHAATISHQQVGLDAGVARLRSLVAELATEAGLVRPETGVPVASLGAYCLAGADFPEEVRLLDRGLRSAGLAANTIVKNDTFAALRAGASRPWGVVLICGHGVNGAAIGRDGREARFDGIGGISGDWGGGHAIGEAALAAAVRAGDGRGARTSLQTTVSRFFGRRSIRPVVRDLYHGRRSVEDLADLAPAVFEAAEDGDAVARGIVDRLADELVAMARALIRRTGLSRAGPEVVLAGGVFRTLEPGFYARLEAGIRAVAGEATIVRLSVPPVLGAGLIGLDALGLAPADRANAEDTLRSEMAKRGWA